MEKLAASLSPSERKIMSYLADGKSIAELAITAKMQEVEVMRACQYLNNKGVLTIQTSTEEQYTLTKKGRHVARHGFPEELFLAVLDEQKTLDQVRKQAGLDRDEVNIAIGILKKQGAIAIGYKVLKVKDVSFIDKIKAIRKLEEGPNKEAPEEFVKRGLVEKNKKTTHYIKLTTKGKKLQKAKLDTKYAEKLTPAMLKTGSWKKQKFRRYDVSSPLPAMNYGRKHFVNEAIAYIKQLWIEMGFTEMTGAMTQTAFWDLDALFVPQDHPAREEQDTFYLPGRGKLPSWWKKIKEVHENGGNTGSKGWQMPYSEDEARKILLRTHTTVLSAQFLKKMREQGLTEGKFFSVAKVFRNETLDWKHLFELHQVEGIVVGEGLSLGDLIGLQKEFFRKMGYTKVRFRPGYFPYTEPSAECEVYNPVKKEWIELGGMGVFRPEMVKPLLGKDVPVLAWGLGMERIITEYYGIKDIREIYDNNIERLRAMKKFVPEWN